MLLVTQIEKDSSPWHVRPSSSSIQGPDQQVDMVLPSMNPGGGALLLAFQRCLEGLAAADIDGPVVLAPILQHCLAVVVLLPVIPIVVIAG